MAQSVANQSTDPTFGVQTPGERIYSELIGINLLSQQISMKKLKFVGWCLDLYNITSSELGLKIEWSGQSHWKTFSEVFNQFHH